MSHVTKTPWTGIVVVPATKRDSAGNRQPRYQQHIQIDNVLFYENGKKLFSMPAWAGRAPAEWPVNASPAGLIDNDLKITQTARENGSGSLMPPPDGVYEAGPFDSTDNHDGMGPWRIPITQPGQEKSHLYKRSGIFFHEETDGIPGSHGCFSLLVPSMMNPSKLDRQKIKAYFQRHKTVDVVIDLLPGDNNTDRPEETYLQRNLDPKGLKTMLYKPPVSSNKNH